MNYKFPEELYIAYAVCRSCNNREFIVSGQTQVCNNCGDILFRTNERSYTLNKNQNDDKINNFKKSKINFPEEILIGYAKCNNASNGEEIVVKNTIICQECKEKMVIEDITKYFRSNKTYRCPVCENYSLYKNPFPSKNCVGSYEECSICKFKCILDDKKVIEKYREKWKKKTEQLAE